MMSTHRGVSPYHDVCPYRGYPLLWLQLTEGGILSSWRQPTEGLSPFLTSTHRGGYPTFMTSTHIGGSTFLWRQRSARAYPLTMRTEIHLTPLFRCSHFSERPTFTPYFRVQFSRGGGHLFAAHLTQPVTHSPVCRLTQLRWWQVTSRFRDFFIGGHLE